MAILQKDDLCLADKELEYSKGTVTLNPGLSVMICLTAFEVPQTITDPIPEPSTMLLLSSGLAGLFAWRLRKVYTS